AKPAEAKAEAKPAEAKKDDPKPAEKDRGAISDPNLKSDPNMKSVMKTGGKSVSQSGSHGAITITGEHKAVADEFFKAESYESARHETWDDLKPLHVDASGS